VDGQDEWYVDEILDSWMRRRRLEYLVKWMGYGWQIDARLKP
jgi:hypothetical protein